MPSIAAFLVAKKALNPELRVILVGAGPVDKAVLARASAIWLLMDEKTLRLKNERPAKRVFSVIGNFCIVVLVLLPFDCCLSLAVCRSLVACGAAVDFGCLQYGAHRSAVGAPL